MAHLRRHMLSLADRSPAQKEGKKENKETVGGGICWREGQNGRISRLKVLFNPPPWST